MKRLFLLPFFIILFSSFSFAQNNQEKVYVDYYGDGRKFELASEEISKGIYSNLARRCDLYGLNMILSEGYLGVRYVHKIDNKSAVLDDEGSTAFNIAAKSNMHKCRAVARWLSDAGVADGLAGGGARGFIGVSPFKKPYIFEDARLKIIITEFAPVGKAIGKLYNKTDDIIQYAGYKYTVNGKTKEEYEKNSKSKFNPEEEYNIHFASYDFNELDPQAGPKIVKNKVTIDRSDIDFTYRYKGKEYKMKLKIGGKDTYDVYYTQDSGWSQHESIRKEQLGY